MNGLQHLTTAQKDKFETTSATSTKCCRCRYC
ncbi:hypothetical protein UM590_03585 [Staphylococcus aureus]|nr:hypothetical protein UM590_03585 [Staphylococcus aureus]